MAAKHFTSAHLRRLVQGLTLLFWFICFLWTANIGLSQVGVKIDPLLVGAHALAARSLPDGWGWALLLPLTAVLLGRGWCGWVCPVGTVLDLLPLRPKRKPADLPDRYRQGKFYLLLALGVMAVFGNLTLIFFDPITLWIRTLTGGLWPALDKGLTALEYALAGIPGLIDPISRLDELLRPAVLPATPPGTRWVWLPVLIFTVIVLLNVVAERFWCRYLCPLGGLLGLCSRPALFRRQVLPDCKGCGLCASHCPTGTISPARGYESDPAECTVCMDCVDSCPTRQVKFGWARSEFQRLPYDPGRRQVLAAGAVAAAGWAVIEADRSSRSTTAHLLRPPGVEGDDFLSKCVRCGACMRTCPTGAIQASITESGLSGLFTPVLVPRLGYCLYTCNQCGQVCPVQAIPLLELAVKQTTVIGKAFIDQDRCIPYTEGTTCIVCEEMCPLPEKAIVLTEAQTAGADGSAKTIQLPRVLSERCIGCGICEYKCPRSGEAAIRVYRLDGTDIV